MIILTCRDPVLFLSFTKTVKLNVSALVGLPEMTAVKVSLLTLSDNPLGKDEPGSGLHDHL